MKRTSDMVIAFLGLLCLAPLLLPVALLIKLDSPGPAMFKQRRVGRGFRPFVIYKFRTMVHDAPRKGTAITSSANPRITRVGRILRKTKIDELPQLINVLQGNHEPRRPTAGSPTLCRALSRGLRGDPAGASRHHRLGFDQIPT
jgi:lipopolysaccharide/colanic/teichoic acid biosynthesis glycosyltransferase